MRIQVRPTRHMGAEKLTGRIVQGRCPKISRYTSQSLGNRRQSVSRQDLRFRDRDDVTPERLLTLRGGASALASLSISAALCRLVVAPCFLVGFAPTFFAVERLGRFDRFPTTTTTSSSPSSSSVSSSAATSAFALPLPLTLLLLAPVSATTVVLVEEADEEDRARLELPPAAETAVDDPEENDGDLSRARRAEEREGAGLACTFLPTASLPRPREVPA